MRLFGTARFLNFTGFAVLPLLAGLTLPMPAYAQQAEESALPTSSNPAQPINETDSNQRRPLSQDSSLLSLQGGQRLMAEANNAVSSQNYSLAARKLQDARQVFNQLSNFYQELASSFSGIDNRVADSQRRKAIETAQMRDEATYQLALVHRAQNQPELAVPLLIQIVRSQNPTRDLGKKAYQQLFELGFVDSPYPKAGNNSPSNQSSSPNR
jgi:cell division septum initiation protein DivIVA